MAKVPKAEKSEGKFKPGFKTTGSSAKPSGKPGAGLKRKK